MYLEKEDVSLYYEVTGSGEPLILIHGVIVDSELYKAAAELLGRYYTVITFDRRGNSRSTCKGERHFSMDEQIEDVRDLMDHLQIDSAYIFGASAGAVIGQYFLIRYPERVKHLIMFEPAVLGEMAEEIPEVKQWVDEMMERIGKRKYTTAILKFAQHINSFDSRSPRRTPEISRREMGNHEYALTQEFPGMLQYHPDRAAFESMRDKITISAGEKSEGTVYYHAAVHIANDLGKEPVYYPGYHNLPYDLPMEFAVNLIGTLMLL
ncbi:MAG: alpha/beta hydrolase [Eubacteriales bacterium]|nr:alpha/beta hydrolase [Eubacteriales bacterium]